MSLSARKRVYKEVAVAPAEGGFAVLLDGRTLKTPARASMVLPCQALAEAVAEEWRSQGETIEPQGMPITQLASTMLDRVAPQRDEMAALVLNYAETDLLCYRAADPPELAAREEKLWQPLLDWLAVRHGAALTVTQGILPVSQPSDALAALRRAILALDDGTLTVLQGATATLGSLVLGLALVDGRLSAEEAFAASQVDETFQAELWGEVDEAAERRQRLADEVKAAARFLALLRA